MNEFLTLLYRPIEQIGIIRTVYETNSKIWCIVVILLPCNVYTLVDAFTKPLWTHFLS